jgi:flagellar motor switch protein FliN/FliY
MTARLQREVNVGPGQEESAPPSTLNWIAVPLSPPGENWPPILFAPSPELIGGLTPPQATARKEVAHHGQPQDQRSFAGSAKEGRNLDLLMEVELPVGVSFGRTRMRLKEAVKLTTGSIVELNRAISEPVEVIVNNCVIARGEVVVIEGNYGIRIHQIVSREERLRTLF